LNAVDVSAGKGREKFHHSGEFVSVMGMPLMSVFAMSVPGSASDAFNVRSSMRRSRVGMPPCTFKGMVIMLGCDQPTEGRGMRSAMKSFDVYLYCDDEYSCVIPAVLSMSTETWAVESSAPAANASTASAGERCRPPILIAAKATRACLDEARDEPARATGLCGMLQSELQIGVADSGVVQSDVRGTSKRSESGSQ